MIIFGETSRGHLCGLHGLWRLRGLERLNCWCGGHERLLSPRTRPGGNAHLLERPRTTRWWWVARAFLFGAHALCASWPFLVAFYPPLFAVVAARLDLGLARPRAPLFWQVVGGGRSCGRGWGWRAVALVSSGRHDGLMNRGLTSRQSKQLPLQPCNGVRQATKWANRRRKKREKKLKLLPRWFQGGRKK